MFAKRSVDFIFSDWLCTMFACVLFFSGFQINFCRKTKINVLGVVENMSAFICPCCANISQLFPATTGGAEAMCSALSVPLIASLPFDSRMAECADAGNDYFEKYPDSVLTKQFEKLAELISKL